MKSRQFTDLMAIFKINQSLYYACTQHPVDDYSRTPLINFRTRLIRSPRYFEGRSNSLGFTLMFSVIYYQLFRTRLFRIPRYFELIVLSLHLKSTPLFRTCQKQSTYIRAQLETYCILFELALRNYRVVVCKIRTILTSRCHTFSPNWLKIGM